MMDCPVLPSKKLHALHSDAFIGYQRTGFNDSHASTKIWRCILVRNKYARSIFIRFVALNHHKYRSRCILSRSPRMDITSTKQRSGPLPGSMWLLRQRSRILHEILSFPRHSANRKAKPCAKTICGSASYLMNGQPPITSNARVCIMPQQPQQHDQKGCQCSCFELVEFLKAPNHQRFLATNLNAIRLGSASVPGVTLAFLGIFLSRDNSAAHKSEARGCGTNVLRVKQK